MKLSLLAVSLSLAAVTCLFAAGCSGGSQNGDDGSTAGLEGGAGPGSGDDASAGGGQAGGDAHAASDGAASDGAGSDGAGSDGPGSDGPGSSNGDAGSHAGDAGSQTADAGSQAGDGASSDGAATPVDSGSIVDAGCGAHVPGDYPTVQQAVLAFEPAGGVICLGAQAFHEAVEVNLTGGKRLALVGASQAQTSVDSIVYQGATFADVLQLQQLSAPKGVTAPQPANTTGSIEAQLVTLGSMQVNSTKLTLLQSVVTGGLASTWSGDILIDRCDLSGGSPAANIYGNYGGTLVVQNTYVHDSIANGDGLMADRFGAVQVVNCTFAHTGLALVYSGSPGSPLEAYDDLFVDNGVAITVSGGADQAEADYNGYFGNTSRFSGPVLPGAHDVQSDPMLDGNSPPGLQPGSPCRGAGTASSPAGVAPAITVPAWDFHGNARSAGSNDIGAVN